VLVNSASPHSGLPAIDADHRLGARLAAEHLLRLGHRVIGHVTAPASNAAARPRLAGVRDAVLHEGLPDSALHVALGDGHVGGGEKAARDLLAIRELTAIACYNDLSAIGVLRAARAAGRRVPDAVRVTGFDGIHPAEGTDPPLTTVAQPIGEMRRWAVFQLRDAVDRASRLERAAPGTAPIKVAGPVHMHPTLIVRGSTGPPPPGGR
jgi:DNA-binding LacI/PurR family transcriptional regulator